MATALKFPDPFKFSALNLALEWAQWRQQFEWFILATRKAEKDEEVIDDNPKGLSDAISFLRFNII